MNRKILAGMLVLIFVTLACGSGVSTQQVDNVSTIVAATIQALTAAPPAAGPLATQAAPTQAPPQTGATQAVATQPSGTPVTFKNVSFIIPNGLAGGAAAEQVAAVDDTSGAPWDVAPAHIHFTLNGYNNSLGKFSVTEISIYPAQGFASANNSAGSSLSKLQAILASPSAPLTRDAMPYVPYFNAGQMVAAQMQRINFASGSGVRLVTQYGQAVGPIANNGTFYHFQGLTTDGKYYIIAVLSVGSSILPSGNDPNAIEPVPAGGVPFPGYNGMDPAAYEAYYQSVADALNNNTNSFTPSLVQLDALIQSIQVSP